MYATTQQELFSQLRRAFPLGSLVSTPGALAAVGSEFILRCVRRHASGDWGAVCSDDWAANNEARENGLRILSTYPIDGSKPCKGDNAIWIITEADRSSTCVLLPSEY